MKKWVALNQAKRDFSGKKVVNPPYPFLRKDGSELHFDFEKGVLTTFTPNGEMSIQSLGVISRNTAGESLHEQIMKHKEEEAHALNDAYDQYRGALN